jgi:Fe-S-cluster containining protein
MYLETNLLKIKQLAAKREDENFRFRTFLKGKDPDKVDGIVHRLHEKYTSLIDCTTCGNCCSCLKPRVEEDDIEILARLEKISSEEYTASYCEEDFGDVYLKDMPCRYADEKKCSIYENRPTQCCDFPYTDKDGFISRLLGMISFYEVCPIVFNLMEELKDKFRFYR